MAVVADAPSSPPADAMKLTVAPTSTIPAAASHAFVDKTVPSATSPAPAAVSRAYAVTRRRAGPPKSANASRAKEPKAANVAASREPTTSRKYANTAGTTTAARTARRKATASRLTVTASALGGRRCRRRQGSSAAMS